METLTQKRYLSSEYVTLSTTYQKRLSLEEQDFKKINIENYYELCDIETILRKNIIDRMRKQHIDIYEDEYASIKIKDDALNITIK